MMCEWRVFFMQKVLVTVEFIKPALVNADEFFGALE